MQLRKLSCELISGHFLCTSHKEITKINYEPKMDIEVLHNPNYALQLKGLNSLL